MAKKPTLTDLTSQYSAQSTINGNNDKIETSFENTLSLDGSSPNSMQADFDLNSNDLLNAGIINATDILISGVGVTTAVVAAQVAAEAAKTAAEAAKTAAEAAAVEAALYDGPWLDDVATLLIDTSLTYTASQPGTVVAGDYVITRKEGFAYKVAVLGAMDYHIATANGVLLYVQKKNGMYNVKAFGAIGDDATDDTAAIQAALDAGIAYSPPGIYHITGAGLTIREDGALIGARPANSIEDDDTAALDSGLYSILVPDTLTASHSLDMMMTKCELSGGKLANPASAEAYTTNSGTRLDYYELTDFTNEDASGVTPATARTMKVMVNMTRRSRLINMILRTQRTNGDWELDAADTNFGEPCDVGLLCKNSYYGQVSGCSITMGFDIAAILAVTAKDATNTPATDGLRIQNSHLQGHSCYMLRGPDSVPVKSGTSTTIVINWFASHQFPASGTVIVEGTTYTYTGTSFATGELTFTGVTPSAAGLSAGERLLRGEDQPNWGTGGTFIEDCFLRQRFHPTFRPSTDGFYTAPASSSGRVLELAGDGVRGVHIENTYIHAREDITLFAHDCGDIYFNNSYHESKSVFGGYGAGSRFIALSTEELTALALEPVGGVDNVHFTGWSQTESQTDRSPMFRTSSSVGRFSTIDGLFAINHGSADDYVNSQFNEYGAKTIRAHGTSGQQHPLVVVDKDANIRASMDNNGFWQFAAGGGALSTAADLSDEWNFQHPGGGRMKVRNTLSTTTMGVVAEDSSGNQAGFTTSSANECNIVTSGGTRMIAHNSYFKPATDNLKTLGASGARWSELFCGNATINTSDERMKMDIADLDAAERAAAIACKGLLKKFRFKDAVDKKGEDARIHFGVVAQDVIKAFEAEGLDPFKYSLICYDEWEARPPVYSDKGELETEGYEAGNAYGIRYSQLLAFIIGAL
jgi:hypothetical protein